MIPTRRAQPYRGRRKGRKTPVERAMTKGAMASGHNPQNSRRALQVQARRRRRGRRIRPRT